MGSANYTRITYSEFPFDENGNPKADKAKSVTDPIHQQQQTSSSDGIANFIGWTLYYIASAFAKLLGILMYVLTHYVVVYNNFLNHNIVATGWAIVRDVCNNFFIIGLLIIAVATILQQPKGWEYKGTLGKLLIMAVLINFSKLATGVLIDISQVVMLFFAEPLRDFGGSLMLVAFGLYGMFQVAGQDPNTTIFGSWQAVVQVIYALIASVIATVVIASVIMVLVYRIVTLWFLVILSPAAFLAYAVPGQQKHFSKWLSRLTSELIVGPVMIFFIYLSVFAGAINFQQPGDPSYSSADGSAGNSQQIQPGLFNNTGDNSFSNAAPNNENPAATYGTWPEQFWSFLIIVGLLVGSLVAGQQVGATGSGFASKGKGIIDGWRNKGIGYAKKGGSMALSGAKDRVKSGLGVVGAGIKALDAAAGGYGARGLNATKKGIIQGAGVGGAAGTAAAIGAVFGGPVGAAVAGIGTALTSGLLRATKERRDAKRKAREAQMAAEDAPNKGETVNSLGERIDSAQESTDLMNGREVGRYDSALGAYIRHAHDSATGNISALYENAKGADGNDILHVDPGTGDVVTAQKTFTSGAYSGQAAKFLDAAGSPVASPVAGGYMWNGSNYVQFSDQLARVRDGNNKVVGRHGDLNLESGTYRRMEEGGQYYRVNEQGEFVDENDHTRRLNDAELTRGPHAANPDLEVAQVNGQNIQAGMSEGSKRFWASYYGETHKGRMIEQGAEQAKIEKLGKNYENMSKEMLQRLYDMERDDNKKKALAMSLAIKNGFRDAEMVNTAKDVLRSNQLMMNKFNESMNKKNLIMNNTGRDGRIDMAAIERIISKGDAKWEDQDLKQMNAQSFELMARMLGPKFAGAVDNMIKTTADKSRVISTLGRDINTRGFTGTDLAMRKVYGATSGQWQQAFTTTDRTTGDTTFNHAEMGKAIRGVSNPEVLASMDKSHFADTHTTNDFKLTLANSIQYNQLRRMIQSDKVSPEQITNYIKALKQVAGRGTNNILDDRRRAVLNAGSPERIHAEQVLTQLGSDPAMRPMLDYWPDNP